MIGEACQRVDLLSYCLRLPREHRAERIETVVGQTRQCIGLHRTDCGSHVKRVMKVTVEPPATVELGLCSQLLVMSLTTLSSLR